MHTPASLAKCADFGFEIRRQLPAFNVKDWLLGGAVGAAGGLGTYAWQSAKKKKPGETDPSLLKHVGIGALAGGATTNLLMDRARRYISNVYRPVGYSGGPTETRSLWPDSLKTLWDAAVRDVPTAALHYKPAPGEKPLKYYVDQDKTVPMRRELLRRSFGIHTDNPKTDWFRSTGTRQFTPTANSGGYAGVFPHVEINPRRHDEVLRIEKNTDDIERARKLLTRSVQRESNLAKDPRLFTSFLTRHGVTYDEPGKALTIKDLWDVALDPLDWDLAKDHVKALQRRGLPALKEPVVIDDSLPRKPGELIQPGPKIPPASQASRQTHIAASIKRFLTDQLLYKDPVVFEQKYRVPPPGTGELATPIFTG